MQSVRGLMRRVEHFQSRFQDFEKTEAAFKPSTSRKTTHKLSSGARYARRKKQQKDLESALVLCDVNIKRKWIGLNDFIDVRRKVACMR